MTSGGLPHSGTRGSTPADGSPRLVAAFRALHRPSTPRHPPCARRSSAAMLAHDHEPTGSTHVHHSPLVNVPETLTSLVRTIHPPRTDGRCLARTPTRPHQPRPGPIKNGPPFGPRHAQPRSPLALRPPLQLEPALRANRPAPSPAPRLPRSPSFYRSPPRPCQGPARLPRQPCSVPRPSPAPRSPGPPSDRPAARPSPYRPRPRSISTDRATPSRGSGDECSAVVTPPPDPSRLRSATPA